MSITYREYFELTEYSEEMIQKIINYRMHKDPIKQRYLTDDEIAELEKIDVEDVFKILSRTLVVWNH